jgi:peptide deformylase
MEIVRYPHPALRWKSRPVAEINARLRSIVREMFELMYDAKGIGLAANQVALPFRLFIVNPSGDPKQTDQELVIVNPAIISRKGSAEGEEGCLSLPEMWGQVRRAEEIEVEAYDLKGREFRLKLKDMPARVVQHETDHLDGVLFPDRMTDTARLELAPQLEEFEAIHRRRQEAGLLPPDDVLKARLRELEGS